MRLEEIFGKGTERSYSKGQIVLYQGEEASKTFLIKSGFVKVYDISPDGSEKLMMILGEKDIFPLVWSVEGKHSLNYFYEVYEDATISVMSRDDFVKIIDFNHEATKRVLRYFITRTRELMLRIECIEATNALHKVGQVMEYLALTHGDKISSCKYKLKFNITQQSIADMAGITRETTSIQMGELEKTKIISNTSDKLVIDTKRLVDLLENE